MSYFQLPSLVHVIGLLKIKLSYLANGQNHVRPKLSLIHLK